MNTEADLNKARPGFVLLLTAIWLISTVVLAFAIAEGNHYSDLRVLTKTGVRVIGRVELLEPTNHDGLVYSYEVAGVVYRGYSHIGKQNISVGDTLSIVYSPENPSLSALGNIAKNATGTLIFATVFGAIVSTLILIALAKRGVFSPTK
jgi:hypothetical protein